MAYALPLPDEWKKNGWRVKIRDDERVEPPHATILHKTRAWRLSLRTGCSSTVTRRPARYPAS